MPSLGRYCQGVIRYRVACQASADTSIILCKEKGLRLWRCFATETLLSHFMQVRSKLPAQSAASSICEICSAPRWSWESSSTWKPSRHHRVASIADSPRPERGLLRWVFIVAGLTASRVQHCWLQPCPRQDHLRLGCLEAWACNQSWEREEETADERSCPFVARTPQFEALLNWLLGWSFKLIGFKINSLVLRR